MNALKNRKVWLGIGGGILLIFVLAAIFGPGNDQKEDKQQKKHTPTEEARTPTPTPSTQRPATVPISHLPVLVSGSGNAVKAVNMGEGVWFCNVSISGNNDRFFSVRLNGRTEGSERLGSEGRYRVKIGGIFNIPPGVVDVEVTATGGGHWLVDCKRQ